MKTAAALPLRRLFRQWEAEEGREIVRQIRRIEIVDDEGALGVVYFPMPSWVMAVWTTAHVEAVKKEIVMTVKRDNPEEKLKDFWSQATSQLIDVVKHHRNIRGLRKVRARVRVRVRVRVRAEVWVGVWVRRGCGLGCGCRAWRARAWRR